MKNRLILLLVLGMMISCTQTKKEETSEPEKIAKDFLKTYGRNGPRIALKGLFRTNKYISVQDADSLGIKLEKLSEDLGNFNGYEKIKEKTYGNGITYLAYIAKYEKQPLRFNFKFYNSGNEWRIQNFGYETNFLNDWN